MPRKEPISYADLPATQKLFYNMRKRVERVRPHPDDLFPPARHVEAMADALGGVGRYELFERDPMHCALSLLAVLEALYKARKE